jgi:hypothetical protein
MRVVVNWLRGNRDGFIEVHEVGDEEFYRSLRDLAG